MNKNLTGRLENWSYDGFFNIIWGEIYNDANGRFVDGTNIHTSNIPGGRQLTYSEGDIVKTLNSRYKLGKLRKVDD